MLKKFYFWVVLSLLVAIASATAIHWKAVEGIRQRTAKVLPLYDRQKVLEGLSLDLEKYRRMSSGFRNLTPVEILETKDHLVKKFDDAITELERLDPSAADHALQGQLKKQLNDLLEGVAEVEPTLFSRDAYVKPAIQTLHDDLVKTLNVLVKNTDGHVVALHLDRNAPQESRSLALLVVAQLVVLALSLLSMLKNYLTYQKPLNSLHQYAILLKDGKSGEGSSWNFSGLYDDIHGVLSKLSSDVDQLVRNRHRFILDLVADLKGPLEMLRDGKLLLAADDVGSSLTSDQKFQSLDRVRRGLAIFSGSLEDLEDIVGINQLQTRLVENTVDLSELLSDVSRLLFGAEGQKRMKVSAPPIPVWVTLDSRRFERGLFHLISKVASTLPQDHSIAIVVNQGKGSFRGIELVVQGAEVEAIGVPAQSGPEQDLLKHWISDNGLSMRLVHKMIKSHGGTINAAGIAGSSVKVVIRLPYERVSSTGLIAPPDQISGSDFSTGSSGSSGLVFKAPGRTEKEVTSVG